MQPLSVKCEYIINDNRIVVQKRTLQDDKSYTYRVLDTKTNEVHDLHENFIYTVIIPVANDEFFEMYINFRNAMNEDSVFYDKSFAFELKHRILETIQYRSYVQVGKKKFEQYDFTLLGIIQDY